MLADRDAPFSSVLPVAIGILQFCLWSSPATGESSPMASVHFSDYTPVSLAVGSIDSHPSKRKIFRLMFKLVGPHKDGEWLLLNENNNSLLVLLVQCVRHTLKTPGGSPREVRRHLGTSPASSELLSQKVGPQWDMSEQAERRLGAPLWMHFRCFWRSNPGCFPRLRLQNTVLFPALTQRR